MVNLSILPWRLFEEYPIGITGAHCLLSARVGFVVVMFGALSLVGFALGSEM